MVSKAKHTILRCVNTYNIAVLFSKKGSIHHKSLYFSFPIESLYPLKNWEKL